MRIAIFEWVVRSRGSRETVCCGLGIFQKWESPELLLMLAAISESPFGRLAKAGQNFEVRTYDMALLQST
jgi:hypothetical protein